MSLTDLTLVDTIARLSPPENIFPAVMYSSIINDAVRSASSGILYAEPIELSKEHGVVVGHQNTDKLCQLYGIMHQNTVYGIMHFNMWPHIIDDKSFVETLKMALENPNNVASLSYTVRNYRIKLIDMDDIIPV